jgi:hypothetical protein
MGGIGILSHLECAPLAYRAAASSSANTLAPLLDDSPANEQPKRQRELCQEVFTIKQTNIWSSLTTIEQTLLFEASSQLGRKWLSAIPSAPRTTLSNPAIQANLAYRTLVPSHTDPCKHCGAENMVGHDEACFGKQDFRISRHEAVKHHLTTALRSITGTNVTEEPFVFGFRRRNDIRVSKEDLGALSEDYDVKVVAITAPYHQTKLAVGAKGKSRQEYIHDERMEWEKMGGKVENLLRYQGQRKVDSLTKEAGLEEGKRMTPIVLSSGGVMEEGTREKFKEWKSWGLGEVNYGWMLMGIAVSLAKARGRTFSS